MEIGTGNFLMGYLPSTWSALRIRTGPARADRLKYRSGRTLVQFRSRTVLTVRVGVKRHDPVDERRIGKSSLLSFLERQA
jgi:hypothetical protein